MASAATTMATTSGRNFWCLCSSILLVIATPLAAAETKLFDSVQVTPAGEYTFGIEGPAADLDGNLFVVNFGKPGTIGRLPAGGTASEAFTALPEGSVGNAIRFDRNGTMFIADYKKHNIFAIPKGATEPVVWFHSDEMSQPNDITIARDGTIYASDPNWKGREGHIWRIAKAADGSVQGQVMTAPRAMGTTNGIDLSPDGNALTDAKLVKAFQPDTIDGLRTDVAGRLYVARILKGTIALMKPNGAVEREIALRAKDPTNLAFGGSDGKTVFVTQRQGGFIESFRTDQQGREHCLQRGRC